MDNFRETTSTEQELSAEAWTRAMRRRRSEEDAYYRPYEYTWWLRYFHAMRGPSSRLGTPGDDGTSEA